MSSLNSPDSLASGSTSLEELSPDQINFQPINLFGQDIQPINLFDEETQEQTNLQEDFEEAMEWLDNEQQTMDNEQHAMEWFDDEEEVNYNTSLWSFFNNLPLDEQLELFLYDD